MRSEHMKVKKKMFLKHSWFIISLTFLKKQFVITGEKMWVICCWRKVMNNIVGTVGTFRYQSCCCFSICWLKCNQRGLENKCQVAAGLFEIQQYYEIKETLLSQHVGENLSGLLAIFHPLSLKIKWVKLTKKKIAKKIKALWTGVWFEPLYT